MRRMTEQENANTLARFHDGTTLQVIGDGLG